MTSQEEKESNVEAEFKEPINLLFEADGQKEEKTRTIALYEEITEESASAVVGGLLYLQKESHLSPQESGELEEVRDPIKLIVSSVGGSAHEMFSIYDTMRLVKDDCEIETLGLGKVMSAAVLILAAGTKGKRRIGKNCRIMLHPVAGGAVGDIEDIENDTKEIKVQQKQYVKCLAEESNLTVKKINSILKRKTNQYYSAEEAVEFGIADEIV